MKKYLLIIYDNLKSLLIAFIIAMIIRSFLFQPFYIPSSSMEKTLLIGDRIFVSKYSYGYSKHSFPFSPRFSENRFFFNKPTQGDLVVFKTPADNRTDYIKRLVGMPGDSIQFINGNIYINDVMIKRKKINNNNTVRCGSSIFEVNGFEETLPNGKKYNAYYKKNGTMKNTDKYLVPINHYFFLGDNRDCSQDSRYLSTVGYVNYINLVGQAKYIFFSNDTLSGSVLKIWNLHNSLRVERFFKKLK